MNKINFKFLIILFVFFYNIDYKSSVSLDIDSIYNKTMDFYDSISNTRADDLLSPENYYIEGLRYYQEGSYKIALNLFEELQKNHPFSQYHKKAIIMEAYLNFLLDDHLKVYSVVDNFIILYPKDLNIPYMLYLKANSAIRAIKVETSSFNLTQDALATFKLIDTNYPNSKFQKDVKEKIEELELVYLIHNFKIAQFQEDRGNYISAIILYNKILQEANVNKEKQDIIRQKAAKKLEQLEGVLL